MNLIQTKQFSVAAMMIALVFFSCNGTTNGEHAEGEHGEEGNEESGTQYALEDTCDEVYNGVRIIIHYDGHKMSFDGTVENTTGMTLEQVRVEVHLSNGVELGPTAPADLGSGEKRAVTLSATDQKFEKWSAHPEVGSSEHGESERHGEEDGEHGRESRSEHKESHD